MYYARKDGRKPSVRWVVTNETKVVSADDVLELLRECEDCIIVPKSYDFKDNLIERLHSAIKQIEGE